MFFFSFLNQSYDIIICVYWFELFSQVSDVAIGPLVFLPHNPFHKCFLCRLSSLYLYIVLWPVYLMLTKFEIWYFDWKVPVGQFLVTWAEDKIKLLVLKRISNFLRDLDTVIWIRYFLLILIRSQVLAQGQMNKSSKS